MAMQHMLFTYSCLYDKVPRLDEPLDGEDLSQDVLNFVEDLCRTIDMLREVEVKEGERKSQMSAATKMTTAGQIGKREDSKKAQLISRNAG